MMGGARPRGLSLGFFREDPERMNVTVWARVIRPQFCGSSWYGIRPTLESVTVEHIQTLPELIYKLGWLRCLSCFISLRESKTIIPGCVSDTKLCLPLEHSFFRLTFALSFYVGALMLTMAERNDSACPPKKVYDPPFGRSLRSKSPLLYPPSCVFSLTTILWHSRRIESYAIGSNSK